VKTLLAFLLATTLGAAELPVLLVTEKLVCMTAPVVSQGTYQWYKGTAAIAGATKSQLSVSALTAGVYYCAVTDSAGTVPTGKVKVGVTSITTAPEIALTIRK
jgi:hypothetical protein